MPGRGWKWKSRLPEAPNLLLSWNFSVSGTSWWVRSSAQLPAEGRRAGRWHVQKLSLGLRDSSVCLAPSIHPPSIPIPYGASRCCSESQPVSPSEGTVLLMKGGGESSWHRDLQWLTQAKPNWKQNEVQISLTEHPQVALATEEGMLGKRMGFGVKLGGYQDFPFPFGNDSKHCAQGLAGLGDWKQATFGSICFGLWHSTWHCASQSGKLD